MNDEWSNTPTTTLGGLEPMPNPTWAQVGDIARTIAAAQPDPMLEAWLQRALMAYCLGQPIPQKPAYQEPVAYHPV